MHFGFINMFPTPDINPNLPAGIRTVGDCGIKPQDPNGSKPQGADRSNEGQNTIQKSIWSNYDGNQNASVDFNEANSNSLFTMGQIKADFSQGNLSNLTNNQQNQLQSKLLGSFNVKSEFQSKLQGLFKDIASGMETKEFKNESEATTWANDKAMRMDNQVKSETQAFAKNATNQVIDAYNKALSSLANEMAMENPEGIIEIKDEALAENDKSLDSLKAGEDKSTDFRNKETGTYISKNQQTVTMNNDGSRTVLNQNGDDHTTKAQIKSDGSRIITETKGNTKEVTTVNANGTRTVETTVKDANGTETVITERYDKKGRLRSEHREVSNSEGSSTTTTNFRRNGNISSQNSSHTITAEGMRFTETSSTDFRRNGSIKNNTETHFDGTTDVTQNRRDGSLKHTEHRIGNITTDTHDYSRSGNRETETQFNGDGSRTKTTTRTNGNNITKTQRDYDSSGTMRSKSRTTSDGTNTTTVEKQYNANGTLATKTKTQTGANGTIQNNRAYDENGVRTSNETTINSSYDDNRDGKAQYSDGNVKSEFNTIAKNILSKLGTKGVAAFNAEIQKFQANATSVVQKGQDAQQELTKLNNFIKTQIGLAVTGAQIKGQQADSQKPIGPANLNEFIDQQVVFSGISSAPGSHSQTPSGKIADDQNMQGGKFKINGQVTQNWFRPDNANKNNVGRISDTSQFQSAKNADDIMKTMLKGMGFETSEFVSLDLNKLKSDLINNNPSVFDRNKNSSTRGAMREDADLSKMDLPKNKEYILAQYKAKPLV